MGRIILKLRWSSAERVEALVSDPWCGSSAPLRVSYAQCRCRRRRRGWQWQGRWYGGSGIWCCIDTDMFKGMHDEWCFISQVKNPIFDFIGSGSDCN